MTTGCYCAIFPFRGGGKIKAFYDWATTGIPMNSLLTTNHESSLYRWGRLGNF